LKKEVQARTTTNEGWQMAGEGEQIMAGGGARTGDEARVRIDTSEGTIIRLGANTEFVLLDFSPEPTNPITRLRLEAGKVWVSVTSLLGGGLFQIDTPAGSATVRGSLMSVAYSPATGEATVTCLEGQCAAIGTNNQITELVGGQQASIPGAGQDPTPPQPIQPHELVEWSQEFPEAQAVVATVTAAPPVLVETPTPSSASPGGAIPQPNTFVTAEGAYSASSTFSAEYPAALAVDGDRTTSWFSAGSNTEPVTVFSWIGAQDDLITSVEVFSNSQHRDPSVRTGFGFNTVTVQILDAAGAVMYEETVALPGTPDPDVLVKPGVVGRTVLLVFSGHEDPTCGGISELRIGVTR
jgi:hypothetical protein